MFSNNNLYTPDFYMLVIAIIAIISPIFTAFLNYIFEIKTKRKYELQDRHFHKVQMIESIKAEYLSSLGELCSRGENGQEYNIEYADACSRYKSCYYQLLISVSPTSQELMNIADGFVIDRNYKELDMMMLDLAKSLDSCKIK